MQIDPTQVTPEEFASLVAQADDQQVADVIRGTGTESVLDRIFQGMEERFKPDMARGVNKDIQFVITDEGQEHPYALSIADGKASIERGSASDADVSITTDIVSFARLVSGQAEGPQLFMSGKLRVAGDVMFSARVMSFFDRPKPSA